ncbi:MAG: ABC transporter permease, partial [candidate division NC10 bacterium]
MAVLESSPPSRGRGKGEGARRGEGARGEGVPRVRFLSQQLQILRADPLALVGFIILACFVIVGIFAPHLTPFDPTEMLNRPDGSLAFLDPPSSRHWFGTTDLGRDVLSQVIMGTRVALIVGFLAALLVTVIGTLIGLFAGYFRGWVDDLLMRLVDLAYSIPFEPFAIVMVGLLRPSIWTVIIAISLLTWRAPARVIRAQVLSVTQRPFIKAARVAGASPLRIIFAHIAPNILPLTFVYMTIEFGIAIVAEASVSFLGFGDPHVESWGKTLHLAFLTGAIRKAWWWAIPPGLCITLIVLSVFFISRAWEEVINPRL